jgi:DNA polymerase III epsilon subunit-like protein
VLSDFAEIDREHPENAHVKTDAEVLAAALIAMAGERDAALRDAERWRVARTLKQVEWDQIDAETAEDMDAAMDALSARQRGGT